MLFSTTLRLFGHTSRFVLASTACLLPTSQAIAYKYINPKEFASVRSEQILEKLGANDSLLKINRLVSDKMANILGSHMVQGMATGTLSKENWEEKYMRPDVLYIYKLGQELSARAKKETGKDQSNVMEFADMFLGYGKHFDKLKKYGLSATDKLDCQQCDKHITHLSKETSIKEFYISILTDMIPYVVFANYLLNSIDASDNNPWIEYGKKYGDLNNKYAKEKLGKTIQIANEILANQEVEKDTAEELFHEGFTFEAWFIDNAFAKGFNIIPTGE